MRANRRTLTITIKNGEVMVRAPLKLSEEKIAEFINIKREWIEKKIQEQTERGVLFADVKNLKSVLIFGKEKRLLTGCVKNFENENEVCVKNVLSLRKVIEKNYSKTVFEAIYGFSKIVGCAPLSLKIRDYKSRWGSCDSYGNININWRVLFLPVELQNYIYIHELCHLKFMAHNKDFWNEVKKYCREYNKRRKELKNYSFLIDLYRK